MFPPPQQRDVGNRLSSLLAREFDASADVDVDAESGADGRFVSIHALKSHPSWG